VFRVLSSKVQGSIQQINSYAQPVDKWVRNILTRSRHAQVIHMLDRAGMLFCKSPSRAHRKRLKRAACGVAIALVGALCLPMSEASTGSVKRIQSLKELADYQLTDMQYKCHNEITFRESSNNRYAVNGSHHGYYQGRTTYLKGKPDDVQFYWYWYYVSSRYGITQYDEPDYCKALHHLKTRGWQ
jgi:hypothetical protein